MAEYDPGQDIDSFYLAAFKDEIRKHPDIYGADPDDALAKEMVLNAKAARSGTFKPFFKQYYSDKIKGQRFADRMPGRTRYEGLTLTDRGQSTDFDSDAFRQVDELGPGRILTNKMRQAGLKASDVDYYIPKNAEDYARIQAQKKADADRAKAQAAADAEAALRAQYAELQRKFGPPPPPQPMITEPNGEDDDEDTQPLARKSLATLAGDEGNTVPGNPDEHGFGWGWY